MYVKTTSRTNKDGTPVRYLHLAHNQWDPAAGRSVPKVLYSFGREDALDRAAIRRLVASLSKLLDPAGALAATAGSDLVFVESRPFGGAFVLDALWRRLGIDKAITGLDHGPRPGRPRNAAATERVLFGLVANRALAPSSKLAAAEWITHDVHIENLPEIGEQACYRAMDWLHGAREHLEARIFGKVATVLNLEVDLLFFDTTSTYFELEQADEEVARNWRGEKAAGEDDEDPDKAAGFRTHGNSKDSRDDLPQIVIGMAVTRDGIPVRCWCWPGNASDQVVIRQVKDEMRDWTLSKIVWVTDRGCSSAGNRRYLRSGDHHYIIGEKLRSGSAQARAALSRQGRYTGIAANMRIKEVRISDHERFVICFNPEAAGRDAHIRAQLVAQLEDLIDGSDALSVTKRAELRGQISARPGLNRYLRVTPGGLLRTDKAKIKAETNLDGKYLLRCSDPHLSAEDIALGYKQLLEVETSKPQCCHNRGWSALSLVPSRSVFMRAA
ncbi:MAG TPA: IS1634 family transposase [Streptosporangiaceae bacterium]|jgi:hypothetical protein|nr:IS1634 family transposase [Streptosporangiaceae bacterium]